MKKYAKLIGILFLLLALGLFGLQMGVLLIQSTIHIEYIDYRLFYIVNILIVISLALSFYLLLSFTKMQKIILTSLLTIFVVVNVGLMISNQSEIKNVTSKSPDNKHIVSIKHNLSTNEAIYYRDYYWIFGRSMERLKNVADEEIQFEWLANDVAAVTYQTTNEQIQQFVATFGYRSTTSYYYVGAEIHGTWIGEGTEVISGPEGITITHKQKTELFDWDHIEQFGTLAIVLRENNEAKWTISLNENFEMHADSSKSTSGDITLYQATTGENEPVLLKKQETH